VAQTGFSSHCYPRPKITPDSDVRTYMVDSNLWDLSRGMEAGAGRVVIPTGHELRPTLEGGSSENKN